jgi:GT2 family glycosyltransferase
VSRVGLVTVTYNSASVIDGFMSSVIGQAWSDWKLYVIDNASTDDGVARVRRDGLTDDRIVLIENPKNRGVAAGNNRGIVAALADRCEKVLLINNDVEFGPDLIGGMVAAMARYGAAMMVPKIRFYDHPDKIWCAGGTFNRRRAFSTVHFGEGETDRGQFETAKRIDYAPTCCMMIDRAVFDQIGMMDENYFVYYDDTDFCFRALSAGIPFWYVPSPVLFHKVSSLTGGMSDFSVLNATRGKVYFIRKHFPRWAGTWIALYQILFFTRLFRSNYGLARYRLLRRALAEAMVLILPDVT